MIGQVVKETVLVNSAEVEKEKVAGGVKLNFTQAVKSQLAQIETNKNAIDAIRGTNAKASVTVDYVNEDDEWTGGDPEKREHLLGIIDTTLVDGDVINVTYRPTGTGAPEDFSSGGVAVILVNNNVGITYWLTCNITTGQTKLMHVEVRSTGLNYLKDVELSDINDLVERCKAIEADVTSNTTDIATNTAAIAAINTSIAGAKRTRKDITLTVANWTLNSSTNLYEYEVTDADVTANHLIEVVMDLANQAKLTDGYVESFEGSYKFYTSVLPTEAITATVIFELTEEVVTQAGN